MYYYSVQSIYYSNWFTHYRDLVSFVDVDKVVTSVKDISVTSFKNLLFH